jgi:hypothetical protein
VNALEAASDGVRLRVRAQPNAKRSALVGAYGDALKIAVAAPPEDGKANAALAEFLAEALNLPAGAVRLARGATSRDKSFLLTGVGIEDVRVKLETLLAAVSKERRCREA